MSRYRLPVSSTALSGVVLSVAAFAIGCGVVVGTVIDKTVDVVRYPSQEWLFLGAYKHDNSWKETWREPPVGDDHGDLLLGLCFSGGGSRSAYFAACVLDELGKRNIPGSQRNYLEECDFISSVSGGSLAAAYYCLNRYREGYPEDHDAFFERMREDMSKNFESRALGRMMFLGYWAPLIFTYYDRGDLMASVWDSNFFDGRTFSDVDVKAPVLLVNATAYDTAQRFLFTSLPRSRISVRAVPGAVENRRELTRGYAADYEPYEILTMESIDCDIGSCPLSTAVVASAAVPNLLGPVNLYDRTRGESLHLGDGGLYDNHGLPTMVDVLAPLLASKQDQRALILIVDAAGYFETGEQAGDVTTIAQVAARSLEISWLRATTYFESTLQMGLEKMHATQRLRYAVISLYDGESMKGAPPEEQAFWKTSILTKVDDMNPVDIMKEVRAIGTRFSVTDEATQAVRTAAPRVVAGALERLERLEVESRQAATATAE